MSFSARARRSARRLVRHFGDPLVVIIEQLRLTHDRMASTQEVEVVATHADVPAAAISRQVTDSTGAERSVRSLKIAGSDLPGVDLATGRWRLRMPGAEAFVISRPVSTGDPSAGSPIMWTIPRTEGAPA